MPSDINISGLKVNELPAAAAGVTTDSLFLIADMATGVAYRVTQQQVKEAIGANSFSSCVPTTMPTNMQDGDVYFPETVGTYTNFLDAGGQPITVTTSDAVVYFIYSTNHFVKKGNTVNLVDYVSKTALQNNFNAVAKNTTALDAAMAKVIKDAVDSKTLYGSYTLQAPTQEVGEVNATTGVTGVLAAWTKAVSIVVSPGQKMKFTAVNTETLGIAGFDGAGVYISTLDSYNLPYGHLWSNARYAALNGTTLVTGRVLYTDVEITIPNNCYLVKACSGNTGGAPTSPLIISLETFPANSGTIKAKADANAVAIASNTNAVTGNAFKVQTLTLVDGNVTANTGALNPTPAGWKRTPMVQVTPGQKIRLTCSVSFSLGASGYDKNGVFVSTLDSYGLPSGHLWSKQRWTALTGLTDPDNSNKLFIDVEIVIPAGVTQFRASSNVAGAAPQLYPLIVALETPDPAAKPVKVQAGDNSTNVENIQKQLLGATDVTGTTIQPSGAISTVTGVVGTLGSNVWEVSDFITVREANEAGKDIYIFFTGVTTGTRSDAFSPTGLCGFDAAGAFLATLDATNIQEGALWDYDRWAQNNFLPVRTNFSGQTHCFTDVCIKIPATCYKVRGQGTITNTNVGTFRLKIRKGYKIENLGLLMANASQGASVQSNYISRVAGNVNAWSRTAGNPNIKRFTFIHFSDIHYDSSNSKENHIELNSFVNDSDSAAQIDAVLCTGDISEGIAGRGKATTLAETNSFATEFLKSSKPVMYIQGNHDDNLNFDGAGMLNKTGVMDKVVSKTELYTIFNAAIKAKYSQLQDVTNKLYSYQDFSAYNIRVIALDRYECPVINDGGGTNMIRYKNANEAGHFYSQAQLDWLQTTLAAVPAGWGVIMLVHGNLVNGIADFATLTCLQGWNLIPNIINAWKLGTTYNHSYTHPVFPDMNTSKTFNFTARGTGEFIMYLGGHSHCPYYGFIPSFPDQRALAVACTFTGGMDQSSANTWGIFRNNNQEIKNSFHIISVDRVNKKLYLTFYGAHKDLSGNITTDSIIIPY